MHIVKQEGQFTRTNDVLLITGDGKTLPDDLERFMRFNIDHDAMCIGRSIKLYPAHVTHYADVDADAGKWVCENLYKNHPNKGRPIRHTLGEVDWFDWCWELENQLIPSDEVMWHGSTALFGVLIGLEMGYERIILAGVPLDSKGHWYQKEDDGPRWTMESYQSWCEFAMREESFKVASLSGYSEVMVGPAPTSWIRGDHA